MNGTIYAISKDKLLSITYENGSIEKLNTTNTSNTTIPVNENLNFDDMRIKGMTDATNFYSKTGPGTWTVISGLLTNYGLGALIVGIPCSLTPPKTHNLGYPNTTLFNENATYQQAYRERAFEIKKKKVNKNMLIGFTIGLILTIAYESNR